MAPRSELLSSAARAGTLAVSEGKGASQPIQALSIDAVPANTVALPLISFARLGPRGIRQTGLYENFWPPRLASYIRPPLAIVNTAIPL